MAEFKRAAVIGTGTMGPGMGAILARIGIPTTMYDVSSDALERAKAGVRWRRASSTASTRRRRRGIRDASATTSRRRSRAPTSCWRPSRSGWSSSTRSSGSSRSTSARTRCWRPTPRASRITAIAEVCAHPERVIGNHWSNPPHLIPMIEVIPGERTSQEVVDRTCALIREIGYHPVVEKEVPGFVENRVLYAIMRECLDLVDRGIVSPRGARPERSLGHRLQARGDRPDGPARHGRHGHLRRASAPT